MSPRRPRIGITPNYKVKDQPQGIPRVEMASNYSDAISLVGGLSVVLVPNTDDGHAEAYSDMIDALLLTGGPDIDPTRYGEDPHEELKPLEGEREAFDLAVLQATLDAGKPVLGVCLGHQEINVALGGTLHQHLPDVVDGYPIEHRWLDRKTKPLPRHDVDVFEGSRLAEVLGETKINSNSSHHQAVNSIAPGLRQTAAAPDGVIEGLESTDGDQILTVQWHPEFLTDEEVHRRLFADLVERARRRARA